MKRKKLVRKIISLTVCVCLLLPLLLPGFSLKAVSVSAAEQSVTRRALTDGQKNIVKRAYQMTDIKWTPEKDIYGWGSGVVYKTGTTYTGLPYGQPAYASYVPWSTSLEGFISAVKNPDSKMYTSYSSYNKRAPYYSVDCSAFVSWAWELDSRQTTSSIKYFATKISSSSFRYAEVGDSLCLAGNHAVLITDITYDSSNQIRSIEISEATTNKETFYCCQKVIYGEGGKYTLEELSEKYFGNGYILYRNNNRYNVSYYHSCAVPLQGDVCAKCGVGTDEGTCSHDYQNGNCIYCGENEDGKDSASSDGVILVGLAEFVSKIIDMMKKIIRELIKYVNIDS